LLICCGVAAGPLAALLFSPWPFTGQFVLVFALFGAAAVIYGLLTLRLQRRALRGRTETVCLVIKRAIEAGFLLWLLSFIVVELIIVANRRPTAQPGADYLIVCGAGLSGYEPSLVFSRRLDKAARYYERNPGVVVIVTGGQGDDEVIPEAAAGAAYLEREGVPPGNILQEPLSRNTTENIRFAEPMIPRGASVVVTTSEFHNYRAVRIAKGLGLDASGLPAETPGFLSKVVYTFREYFSVMLMYLGR
jgi:uncharacterized SAM-binding protein YcdF (DUF218 family)